MPPPDNKRKEVIKMKKHKMTLSKEALICYLMNELGNSCKWEVSTYISDNDEWVGAIDIRFKDAIETDDKKYFAEISK